MYMMTTPALKGKLVRYGLRMQQYEFEIQERPGTSSANRDGLSRLVALTQPLQDLSCCVSHSTGWSRARDSCRQNGYYINSNSKNSYG